MQPKTALGMSSRYFGDPGDDWSPDEITNLEPGSDNPKTTALHCEIEGDGMKAACAAATVGAVVGTAGGVAVGASTVAGCLASGVFFLLCLLGAAIVAAATAAVATGVGYLVGTLVIGGSKGSPADVGESGTIEAGDHVAIIGDWIYDSAHDGWHELHPVKALLKLRCPTDVPGIDPEYPDSPESKLAKEKFCLAYLVSQLETICHLMTQRNDPAVTGAQDDPRNQWLTHPRLG
jgi:hypothetical protein